MPLVCVSGVCSAACSGTVQSKHQSSALLALVRRIHRWPVNSPHEGPVTRKCFIFWWRYHGCSQYLPWSIFDSHPMPLVSLCRRTKFYTRVSFPNSNGLANLMNLDGPWQTKREEDGINFLYLAILPFFAYNRLCLTRHCGRNMVCFCRFGKTNHVLP